MIIFYTATAIFLLCDIFTNYFVNELYFAFDQFYYILGTPLYTAFIAVFILSVIYVLFELGKAYKSTSGVIRSQVKYLILAFSIGFSGGVSSYFPVYRIEVYPAWNATILISVLLATYAIVRYRLMDIRIAARKFFIYVGVAGFTYGIFYLVTWIYNEIFGGVYTTNAYMAGLFISPVFVFAFYGLNKLLIKISNKYLFVGLYNYQETINKLSQELNHYNDLNKIINLIVETIKKTMRLNRAGVLLINQSTKPAHFQIAKVVGFNEQNGISLVQDNFLTKYLQTTQKPLVRDELLLLAKDSRNKKEKDSFSRLHKHMEHIEASLCLPLMSSDKLIGIIVLGAKLSNDAYSKEDLELLSTLTNQAGTAIDNAKLYQEVQDFNKTLTQKVDEQTGQIKEKNKYLNELLEMKTDFLRVVNHQLNTPLSVMRGYFSMIDEGSYPVKKGVALARGGLERISQTVADFWDAYELEGERMKMEPQKVDITSVVDRLLPEKKKLKLAVQRKLKLSVEKPDFEVPPVWCDLKKIAHVISNLLDNAVFYTEHGSVTVSYELVDNSYVKVNVKDTGWGISKEDKKKLFKKFSRGSDASGLHPDGSGLGLYIARKIVEGNSGEMTYSSEGRGKGSTFSFTLPIYKNQKREKGDEDTVSREKNIVIFDENI